MSGKKSKSKSKPKKKPNKKSRNKNILSTKVDRHELKKSIIEPKTNNSKSGESKSNDTDMDEILDKFDDSDGFDDDNSYDDEFDEDNDNDNSNNSESDSNNKNVLKGEIVESKLEIKQTEAKLNKKESTNSKSKPKLNVKSLSNSFPILKKLSKLPKQKSLKKGVGMDKIKLINRITRAENIDQLSKWKNVENNYPSIKFDKLIRIKDVDYANQCFEMQKKIVKQYILRYGKNEEVTLEFTDKMKPKKKKTKSSGDSLGEILRNPTMAIGMGDQFYCYSDRNSRRLFLDKPLVTDNNVQLYILKREIEPQSVSKDDNHKLIVKNYTNSNGDRDIKYEIGVYQSIRSLLLESGYERFRNLLIESYTENYNSLPPQDILNEIETTAKNKAQKLVYRVLPYFSSSYMMYGQPVLILELLQKLDQTDDPYNIGFEVIHHLSYIHQIGIHADIKPENIMKIARMSDGKRKMFYYLIDFGGLTNEKFPEGGYRRFVWSPKWTTQIKPNWYKEAGMDSKESEKIRRTCPRYDFIELGVTMRVFQITSKLPTLPSDIDEKYLHDFTKYKGRLKKYMEYVLNLPNSETYPQEVYRDLQDILSPLE